ncbi:hypothetical protein FACS1894211_14850 [Clostridia bacterium]|nr:hypothetical protein FACS1894211_14850 [Clostridia bacterium]
MTGTSHAKSGGVCQDAHQIELLPCGRAVAAVADGVGSAKHSDVAAKLAVETLVAALRESLTKDSCAEDIKRYIASGYAAAEQAVEAEAERNGDSITEYDTTLSAVVYGGKGLVYGHSGDGGIVGLTCDGEYVPVTTPQKAADGICVVPLRAGASSWVIDSCESDFASVLLATDGIYDLLFPYLLKGRKTRVYVPFIRYFMDNEILAATPKNIQSVKAAREAFLSGEALAGVTDDKTVAVIVNSSVLPRRRESGYYAEPDWAALQEEWNRKAYPHLYSDPREGE